MAVPILDGNPSWAVNQTGTTSLTLNLGGVSLGALTTAHGNGFLFVFSISNGSASTGISDTNASITNITLVKSLSAGAGGTTDLWRARIPAGGLTSDAITIAYGGGNTYAVGMAGCVSDPSGGLLLVDADASSSAAAEGLITTTSPNCFVFAGYRSGSVANPVAGVSPVHPVVDNSNAGNIQQFCLTEYVTSVAAGIQGMTYNGGVYNDVNSFIAESVSLTGTIAVVSVATGYAESEW